MDSIMSRWRTAMKDQIESRWRTAMKDQIESAKLEQAEMEEQLEVTEDWDDICPDPSAFNITVQWTSITSGYFTFHFSLDYAKRIAFNQAMTNMGWKMWNENDQRQDRARMADSWKYTITDELGVYAEVVWIAMEDGDACRKFQVGERSETKVYPIYEVICP